MSDKKVNIEKTATGFKVTKKEQPPTVEEMQMQTLLNTEYLVIMSEINSLGAFL